MDTDKKIDLFDPVTGAKATLFGAVYYPYILEPNPINYQFRGEITITDEKNPLYILLATKQELIKKIGFLGFDHYSNVYLLQVNHYKYSHIATNGLLVYYNTLIHNVDTLDFFRLMGDAQ